MRIVNDNHSVAYCMLGYFCAYFRYHYPLEFLTAFLNDAANDDDIVNGTTYASKVGIQVTMPKWGLSKGEYFFDKDKKIIAKGLTSIKYMGDAVAQELYDVAKERDYERFIDVLYAINKETKLDTRQLDILIKIDFFSEFGNQRELLRIAEMFMDRFKKGDIKKIKKSFVDGTVLEPIVKKYAVGVTKSGTDAKSYTIIDCYSILCEIEDAVKAVGMTDLSDIEKVLNFKDILGYIGYTSGKKEDRPKLYILDVFPVKRKKDGKQFGYSVMTKSIGSGKESRFTIFNKVFDTCPLEPGNIILCKGFEREGGAFFTMTKYERIY